MPPTNDTPKLKLQVAREFYPLYNQGNRGKNSFYCIGIDLEKQPTLSGQHYTWGSSNGHETRIEPELFESFCSLRLRQGQGPITIADEDNPLALPVKEGE